jgi:hypothetical protein
MTLGCYLNPIFCGSLDCFGVNVISWPSRRIVTDVISLGLNLTPARLICFSLIVCTAMLKLAAADCPATYPLASKSLSVALVEAVVSTLAVRVSLAAAHIHGRCSGRISLLATSATIAGQLAPAFGIRDILCSGMRPFTAPPSLN